MQALKLPREVRAYTTVNGERVHMHPGDLLLTPGWHWHDHEHQGEGRPRGVLCSYHNRLLGPRYTPELMAAYARYLNRDAA